MKLCKNGQRGRKTTSEYEIVLNKVLPESSRLLGLNENYI